MEGTKARRDTRGECGDRIDWGPGTLGESQYSKKAVPGYAWEDNEAVGVGDGTVRKSVGEFL